MNIKLIQKLQDFNAKKKTVLLRLDFNVPIINGELTDASRIERTIPTINFLLSQGTKVIIMSHFGRPGGTFKSNLSLQKLIKFIEPIFNKNLIFLPDFDVDKIKSELERNPFPSLFLLENTRFLKGEEENDIALSKELASIGDFFCNDAFSTSHRAHASTEGISKFLPSCAGFLIQEELSALSEALESPNRPIAAIVGGSKISTKLNVLNNLIQKVDFLIIGGAMANTMLYAKGMKIGKSLIETDMTDIAKNITIQAKATNCHIILPNDIVCAKLLKENVAYSTYESDSCPEGMMILDIGVKTQSYIKNVIDKCQTLIWNGPLGAFEIKPFDGSTIEIARHVANNTKEGKLRSVAGGGDTVSALKIASVENDLSYISTAGGAFLEWLEGKKLPGIESLKK